jgi:hypothetical protein
MSATELSQDEEQQIKAEITSLEAQLATVRDAAKQIATVTAVIPTLYFGVLSFSDLRKTVHGWEAVPFLLPAIPWLASQLLLAGIFVPRFQPAEDWPARAKRARARLSVAAETLRLAYLSLAGGVILLVGVLAYLLIFVPAPPASK